MLKIKKIKLNGFRGILHEKEIDCSDNNLQTNSLVLYGPNSTGKTSFVDGIEWFLARTNQIDWLRRDQAKEAAYPHHAADESFVEIEFKKDGTDKTLRKTFDHNRVTIPTLEPEEEFSAVYDSFVIKPYLRYQEIVEFVLNSTGVEKYKKLAEWMGFEYELAFQKKMAEIAPELDAAISQLERNVQATESSLVTLSDNTIPIATDENILQYVNGLFSQSNETKELVIGSYQELSEKIPELEKLQIGSDRSRRLFTLTAAESYVESKSFSESLSGELSTLKNDLNSFKETESVARNVDTLSLYTKAQALLANEADGNVPCPVCHTEWEKMNSSNT